MELAAHDVSVLHGRGQGYAAVLGGGDDVLLAVKAGEGMHEVDVIALRKVRHQRALLREGQRIPAHVGHIQPRRKKGRDIPDFAVNQAQTLMFAVLKGFVKEELHAQADAHERLSCEGFLAGCIKHAGLFQFLYRVAEGADTRQNQPVRLPQHLPVSCDDRLFADQAKRALQGKQISRAVIDNRNHPSSFLSVLTRSASAVFSFMISSCLNWKLILLQMKRALMSTTSRRGVR